MTVIDVVARVEQLRSQLGLAPVSTTSTSSTGASRSTGTSFASALSAAQGLPLGGAGSATGADAVAAAKKYLGVPYVWGGTNPATGLDCSGLIQRAYGDLGITLPRVAADQAKVGRAVASLDQAKPGDLLAFNSPVTHIAMYVGNGMMIAAPHAGDKVKIQKVYATPTAIRRILPEGTAGIARTAGITGAAGGTARSAALSSGSAAGVPYADLFNTAGAKYGVSPKLLAAVAKTESGYNPNAVSGAGARGLMQIMPGTASGLGIDPLNPAQAVDGAARLLAGNLREFGSLDLALAAYNAGGGAVHRYGGIPPYAETQAYVPKVKAALAALGGGV